MVWDVCMYSEWCMCGGLCGEWCVCSEWWVGVSVCMCSEWCGGVQVCGVCVYVYV